MMASRVNIIAVGSNELIAAEVESIVRRIVGSEENIRAMISSAVTGQEAIDLYVCAITQREPLLKKVPPNKLCVLDLRPTAQFFIEISHIPAGETVYIFNSNKNYAALLREMCREYRIHSLTFETIAYEDMSEAEVIEKLKRAKYIIGVGKIVGAEVLLSEKYRRHLRDDVTIIGRTRMATMQTACNLIERVRDIINEKSAREISDLAEQLRSMSPTDERYPKVVSRMEALMDNQKQDIYQHIMDSLAAQLSDRLSVERMEESGLEMADILNGFDQLQNMSR